MADRSLRYVVSAVDKNAGKTIGDVATHGSKAAATIGGAFGKLSGVLGGEVGELASKLKEHFDELGEHGGHGLAAKLEVGGAAMLGIGASLTAMGDAEKQATDQLETAVTNAGGSFEELDGKIEGTVGHMEKYGFTAIQTKNALTSLTNATHDPEQALGLMGEAADLAASRHITLNSAADMLSKTVNGSTRLYKLYGIQVKTNADGTKDLTGAQEALAQQLHGQADSAANNFTGRLRALRAEVEDNVAAFGQKYGPAITAAGAGMLVLGPIIKGAGSAMSALKAKFTESGEAATAAATETAAADEEIVASNEAAAASGGKLNRGAVGAAVGLGGLALGIGAVVAGGFALSDAIDGTNNVISNMEKSSQNTKDALGQLQTQLVNSKAPVDALGESWAKQAVQGTGLVDKAAQAGITIEQLTGAVTGNDAEMKSLISTWQKSGTMSGNSFAALVRLHNGYQQQTKAAEEARASAKKETEAQDPLAAKLGITTSALKAAEQAAAKQASSNKAATLQMVLENNAAGLLSAGLDKLNGRTLNVEQAHIAFRNAEKSVTDSIKQNGKALGDNTQKGRDNRSAVLSAIQAAQQHAQAVATQTGSTEKATSAYQRDIGALRQHLIAIGLDRDTVQTLIDKYAKVPTLKKTKIDVEDDQAKAALQEIQSYLHGLAYGVTVPVRVQKSGIGNEATSSQGHAGGSDFFSGGQTLIAEREPEIVTLPRGSKITPESMLRSKHATAYSSSSSSGSSSDLAPLLSVLNKIYRAILSDRTVMIDGFALDSAMGRRSDRYLRGH